jgi:hypothetical protein
MAHTSCPNGHSMWNGDGKPVVWAYRVNYFRDFVREHPDAILDMEDRDNRWWQIYDCVDDVPGEDLDCWFCDECKGLTVFVDIARYDFQYTDDVPDITVQDVSDWEEYIALRDEPFEDFQDFYSGKNPLETIETYDFEYKYRLSPDKRIIFAFNRMGHISFGFTRSNYMEFAPTMEIQYGSGDNSVKSRPLSRYEESHTLHVEIGMYALLKENDAIKVEEIIIPGELYRGHSVKNPEHPPIEVAHKDIIKITEVLGEHEID